MGRADRRRPRRRRPRARAPPPRAARGGVRDRRRGDGQAARARARRDGRRGRDGALRRGRGAPLLRPDDDGDDGQRTVLTVRQPLGVAALVMSFNTPLPNVAWKAFPAIFCGNAAVVKPSEHTPASASFFAELALEAGVPPGVLNVVHGLGAEAGPPLVAHPDVDLVSFTGSAATGRAINEARRAGSRRPASSSAARTRSSSATTPTSTTPSAGRSRRRSRTPGSAARPRAGSSSSTPSTTRSASGSSPPSQALEPQPVISAESLERILASIEEAPRRGRDGALRAERLERPGWYLAPTVVEARRPTPRSRTWSCSAR